MFVCFSAKRKKNYLLSLGDLVKYNAMFQNRPLLIATKHQKERVIAPILEKNWG